MSGGLGLVTKGAKVGTAQSSGRSDRMFLGSFGKQEIGLSTSAGEPLAYSSLF